MKNNFYNFLQTSSLLDQQNISTDSNSCALATELCDFKMDVKKG